MYNKLNKISLPCLRGKMGDTFFYSTLLPFKEIARRVKLPSEIDRRYDSEDLKLGDWIQRKIAPKRIESIVAYLEKQEQRFFNSIIVGIFDGDPSWQDLNIKNPTIEEVVDDDTIEYFNRTFGILTLSGDESMFAIDGQHRAISIRQAVAKKPQIAEEEVSVIFIGHTNNDEGKIRTRRLFSTLNKYAKPVSQSEIIALSEDNNCAIITRNLIENSKLFKNRVLINKNRSISVENTNALTNIMVLYDLIEKILTDKAIHGIKVTGYNKNTYTTKRVNDNQISKDAAKCLLEFDEIFTSIPSVSDFFDSGHVNRKRKETSLIFRPIGQNVLIDVLKVANVHHKKKKAIAYFAKDDFNLKHSVWKNIFLNIETNNISTDKSKQRFATLLILEKIGINIKKTVKDLEVFKNYNIDLNQI